MLQQMNFRACLLLACVSFAFAQTQMSVPQITEFVRSELARHPHDDKEMAVYVRKIRLTEKLTDKVILDLQAQGVGPKTLEALKALRDETANLHAPAQDVSGSPATADPQIPAPDATRQDRIIDAMRNYAVNYTQNLPNFLCVQVIRRSVDPNAGETFRSLGTILSRVGYNEGKEHYSVFSVDGKLVDGKSMETVGGGGAISTGEFGSLMRGIFEPASAANFSWEKWTTLRGHRTAVFNYSIDRRHSIYSITDRTDNQSIITAYRGQVYADGDTGQISRIIINAVDIPTTFPIRDASELLEYGVAEISGKQYVVPTKAELLMHTARESDKNEIEFRNYHKYGTDSSITFGSEDTDAPAPHSH
jgi:hypothetical protein